ncbi:MAG: N-acetylmuramoyl-L-alanine amidase [Brevefilum sp.]|nr:N-acetylmuramoyl-L-alanine amidase [Brevefilum sp.]MDT8382512.1 N-acetylmuramoyl-L-alanine amidase [Brevefilum sp.]MDW7755813.1 N-acetylmuramoyl-L-alanine amidase [Brevefilum sp.]
MKKITLILAGLIFFLSVAPTPVHSNSRASIPDDAQITDFLNHHPLLVESGASVLDVYFQGEALVINLDQYILPQGEFDEDIFTQLQADLDKAFDINRRFMTTFKVEGQTLDHWGQPMPVFEDLIKPPEILDSTRSGPLSGVKVALSPGHGLYWNEYYGEWWWQRSEFWGIREDTLNSEIMRYVQFALINQGAMVIQLRQFNPNAGIGVSGYPTWQENSRQYAIAAGLPATIYDGSSTNYNSDIRTRPYMANYYGADIFLSLHNNGWDGTLTGTETYYDHDNNPWSLYLAYSVHNRIISTIKGQYDLDWWSRGVKKSYDAYGEINYAQMPAILIELAFMDTFYPDNTYLHDEAFKIITAKAIVAGICDFRGVTCQDISVVPPELNHRYYLPRIMR